MIDKILNPILEHTGKALVKGATSVGKAIIEHVTKHGTKYLIGIGGTILGRGSYVIGKLVGHKEGKIEGTAEQAKREAIKRKQTEEKHQRDREEWERIDKEKEDLLNDLESKINK